MEELLIGLLPGSSFIAWCLVIVVALILFLPSIRAIGPTEVGLVMKRFSFKKLSDDNPIAFSGEAGYQAGMLMPGFRFKFWILYNVKKFPWVQVPAGEIGVVIAQIGKPLPVGAKSAEYKSEFGNFTDLKNFTMKDGQKGIQRPVLPGGTTLPMHPVAFLIITREMVYGIPLDPSLKDKYDKEKGLRPGDWGLADSDLRVTRIEPEAAGKDGRIIDTIGIVTTREGDPLPPGDIACRLGAFDDIKGLEKGTLEEKGAQDSASDKKPEQSVPGEKEAQSLVTADKAEPSVQAERVEPVPASDNQLIEVVLGSKNHLHNNYQDFQAFLKNGGKIGLQHDPLLYGSYNLNPFLVKVEKVSMLVVEQGEVAVIKAYVGLPTEDTSGTEFKYGSLVKPGHRGIWREPLRTGKFAINPRCYEAKIVPTYILTLNWVKNVSGAHLLDEKLEPIGAKSTEGFEFHIDLQVQIHIPDTKAPRVISIVGSVQNLVNEVLQPAVGNHFRDKLQALPAVTFIQTRQTVQQEAMKHIEEQLQRYEVETKGVYIQDVTLPAELTKVLKERAVANQEIDTYKRQKMAQDERIQMELAKGQADKQASLGESMVEIQIKDNKAKARENEGRGEASYTEQTGTAQGAKVKSIGMARAEAYAAQVKALGQNQTAIVNAITALAENGVKFVPNILVAGGNGSGAADGALAALMDFLTRVGKVGEPAPEKKSETLAEKPEQVEAAAKPETTENAKITTGKEEAETDAGKKDAKASPLKIKP